MFKNQILVFIYGFAMLTSFFTQESQAQANRNAAEYNLEQNVGLKGYDPVTYFAEGGGKPEMGLRALSYKHEGAVYYFASEVNRTIFAQNPEKYEPTYGGWCAYAMTHGRKVDIKPTIYSISGRRLHVFAGAKAKEKFDADIEGHEVIADEHWRQISGEAPRL